MTVVRVQLSRLRMPVVVKGSRVEDWRALELWTPQYLAKKVCVCACVCDDDGVW
jgi:hypothetical protein